MDNQSNNTQVLLVEDEVFIALDIADQLADLGYGDVSMVHDLETAEKAVSKKKFDLAILDVKLDGSSTSLDLASKLQAEGTRIIFSTGYTNTRDFEQLPNSTILEKPFDQSSFRHALKRALN
jgi:formate hydrogenlyase transcriptional activator